MVTDPFFSVFRRELSFFLRFGRNDFFLVVSLFLSSFSRFQDF